MKLFFIAAVISIFVNTKSLRAQVIDYSLPIVPIFIDEFDKGEVDTFNWKDSRFYKSHTRFWPSGIREQQYYIKFDDPTQNPSENYIFELDNLIGKDVISLAATNNPITAKAVDWMNPSEIIPEDNLNLPNQRTFNFRSGELDSRIRFKYGMFFIRFRMPKGCGFWPAFWLYSGTHSDYTCINSNNDPNFQSPSYCAGDEIDFFEWESENPTLLPINLHYDHQSNGIQYDIPTNQNLSDDYHLLLIEWQPNDFNGDGIIDDSFLNWYFDPHIYPTKYPLYPDAHRTNNFEYNMSMIINNAVGGPPYSTNYSSYSDFEVNCIDGATSNVGAAQFPAKFSIDHISVFYRIDCNSTENICNWNPDKDLPAYTGGVINVAGNNCELIVPGYEYDQWNSVIDGRNLKFIASDRIVLKPGFHAKKGSRFSATIESDCPRMMQNNIIDTSTFSLNKYFEAFGGLTLKNEESQGLTNENYFKVFPNPSEGIFNLKYSILLPSSQKNIKVYNQLGEIVLDKSDNSLVFDLTNFADGIYFLEVQTESETYREKIIKQ